MKSLFSVNMFKLHSSDHNSGGKIIQMSDHKNKSEHKKHKNGTSGRSQQDTLARNIKGGHSGRIQHSGQYKSGQKTNKKNNKKKFSIFTIFYYVIAGLAILFGLYILFGGLFSPHK
ncbi:hypothetical protein QEJ31_05530 [Pigmentibacter sp. JX0631]|uniref:hypothetical protein n=1 Tax=Pigmentibacter sp. JX0631 TaxID=2976982 RepID=UPI0024683A2D|nr:hypothetical protein [Pigmentibacter sp. JX0631]WGL61054.1 hypothetical protein QEJ31_05530 [Pigmentibacter sp. JX0631]